MDEHDVDAPDDVDEFAEAVKAIRERVPIPDEEWKKISEAEQEYAFKVANVNAADIVTQVLDALTAAVEQGRTFDDFKADVGPMLEESWGGEDPGLLGTVFETNVMGSYSAGRQEIYTSPTVKKARPYWRFSTIGDDRVSEICEPCEGVILPQDHDWWDGHTPLLHHRCRHTVDALSEAEAQDEGITRNPPSVHAAPGFGKRSTRSAGRDWTPDLLGYPEEVREVVEEKI
jgi:hypothetical protein